MITKHVKLSKVPWLNDNIKKMDKTVIIGEHIVHIMSFIYSWGGLINYDIKNVMTFEITAIRSDFLISYTENVKTKPS